MRILICNDSRGLRALEQLGNARAGINIPEPDRTNIRKAINYDALLIESLEDDGHEVILFDAYEDDLCTQVLNPEIGARSVKEIIENSGPDSVLFDLQYHGNFDYGRSVLRHLSDHCAAVFSIRFFVASRFLRQTMMLEEDSLLRDFPFVRGCFNRFSVGIDTLKEHLLNT